MTDKKFEQSKKDKFEIQKAIRLLIDACLDKNGNQKKLRTSKPLVFHSLEVGLMLFNNGYDKNIVISGILHDILEDTNITKKEIEKKFGNKIVDIVLACSYDRNINDNKRRHEEMYCRCKKYGKEALIVKTADILENLEVFCSTNLHNDAHEKWSYFLEQAKEISSEPIYKKLEDKLKNEKR